MKIVNRFDPSYCNLSERFSNENLTIVQDCSIITDDVEGSVAWLVEPDEILSYYIGVPVFETIRNKIISREYKFSKLYTSFRCFSDLPNVVIVEKPPLTSWISDEEASSEHMKNKDLAFITSNKTMTHLQSKRVLVAEKMLSKGLVVNGRGYCPVNSKSDVLSSSRFCVSIENSIHEGYHTEKVLDCFRTKTVPLYVGDPLIEETYDKRGMFLFRDVEELLTSDIMDLLLNGIPADGVYDSMIPFIEENKKTYDKLAGNYDPLTTIRYILENHRE